MKKGQIFAGILLVIVFILLMVAVGWLVQGNDFFLYKAFAPKYQQVQREVFKQSQSYNDGMAEEMENMHIEYIKSTPEHKDAIASIILHRVASYDVDKLPNVDLREFIRALKRGERP